MKNQKEFTLEINDLRFSVEVNKGEDGNVFLYCKTLSSDPKFFFMSKDKYQQWIIISRFTVPPNILAMETLLAEELKLVIA